jgi:hypothetical protein
MSSNQGANVDPSDVTVACYVRAPMLLEPVDAHVETLRACETENVLGGLLLRSWPEKVSLADGLPDREVLERFEEFEGWADRRGVSVRPPFEVRERTSSATGEFSERLVTPLIALALYDEGLLVGVYPHSADGETYTVEDAIARLRTGDLPTPLSGAAERPARIRDCPSCDGPLVNGQGLFACPGCGWAGTVGADGRYEELDEAVDDAVERPASH